MDWIYNPDDGPRPWGPVRGFVFLLVATLLFELLPALLALVVVLVLAVVLK